MMAGGLTNKQAMFWMKVATGDQLLIPTTFGDLKKCFPIPLDNSVRICEL